MRSGPRPEGRRPLGGRPGFPRWPFELLIALELAPEVASRLRPMVVAVLPQAASAASNMTAADHRACLIMFIIMTLGIRFGL